MVESWNAVEAEEVVYGGRKKARRPRVLRRLGMSGGRDLVQGECCVRDLVKAGGA